jgi:hypothetical protein
MNEGKHGCVTFRVVVQRGREREREIESIHSSGG